MAAAACSCRLWRGLLAVAALLCATAVGDPTTTSTSSSSGRLRLTPEWPAVLVPMQPRDCLCEDPTEAACGCGAQPVAVVAALHRRQAENVRKGTGYVIHMHISHCGGRSMYHGFAQTNGLAPPGNTQGCPLGTAHRNVVQPPGVAAAREAFVRRLASSSTRAAAAALAGDGEAALEAARQWHDGPLMSWVREEAGVAAFQRLARCTAEGRRWGAFEEPLSDLLRMDIDWTSENMFYTISIRHPFWRDTGWDGHRQHFFPEVDVPNPKLVSYNASTPDFIKNNRYYNRKLTRFLSTRNYWTDNYQLQWLAGLACGNERYPQAFDEGGLCNHTSGRDVTVADLELAKNVLSRFSHIVIMGDSDPTWFEFTMDALVRRLGLSEYFHRDNESDQRFSTRTVSIPTYLRRIANFHARAWELEKQPGPPPERLPDLIKAYEQYRDHNRYTFELFAFAKMLAYAQSRPARS